MRNREQTPLMLSAKKKHTHTQIDFGGIEGVMVEVGYKRWNCQREHGQCLGIKKSNFYIKFLYQNDSGRTSLYMM